MSYSLIAIRDLLQAFILLHPADDVSRYAIAEFLGFKKVSEKIKDEKENESSIILKPSLDKETVQKYGHKSSTIEKSFLQQKENNETLSLEDSESNIEQDFSTKRRSLPTFIPSEIKFISQDSLPLNIGVSSIPRPNPDESNSKIDFEPLLNNKARSTIIHTALATMSHEGDLDLDRIIELIIQYKSVNILPRHYLSTLRRGVQVLADVGESMVPYRRDQVLLQSEVRKIVGADNTSVFRFIGTPLKGVMTGFGIKFRDYKLPRPGTPILLLTDLGIGRPPFSTDPASISDWIEFINIVKKNKCPIVALIPYSIKRWPIQLKSLIQIIYWDRFAILLDVRKKIGRGHIVPEDNYG